MHVYGFDVKLYAAINIKAATRKAAEDILRPMIDQLELRIAAPEPGWDTAVSSMAIYLDDEGFPYLFEVDGEPVCDSEADAELDPKSAGA